jgi:prepilin-type N-terminal cleavage/methylation domain-containing protein
MKVKGKRQKAKGKNQAAQQYVMLITTRDAGASAMHGDHGARGFSLVELMIAMVAFLIIGGAVVLLLGKSQTIFRAEQGVSEMDQNARLMMDFLTRDIQQSKENGLGLGQRFRTIYSKDGADGKTDEVTIVTADTQSKIPTGTLPLVAGSSRPFSVSEHYVELLPGGASRLKVADIAAAIAPNEEFVITATRPDGTLQFDFIKAHGARVTQEGLLGLSFDTVDHPGVTPEIAFGAEYENGGYTLRPVTIKRYFVDRQNKEHPTFTLSVNGGTPITIARNVVAFQLRYLEVREGETDGNWVKQQSISRQFKTQAIEVTMTARTEIKNDDKAERLVTLASVVRPRLTPGGNFGSAASGGNGVGGNPSSPGGPGDVGAGGGPGGYGGGDPGGYGNSSGQPRGYDADGNPVDGNGGGNGFGDDGIRRRTRYIGRKPKLHERLNPRPGESSYSNQ